MPHPHLDRQSPTPRLTITHAVPAAGSGPPGASPEPRSRSRQPRPARNYWSGSPVGLAALVPRLAIGYNAVALPIVAGVFSPSIDLVLRPEIAALTMSGSSLLVATNAMLLRRLRLPAVPDA